MELLTDQSHHFDIPPDIIYLNAATMGPLPITAAKAGDMGLRRKLYPWEITSNDFFKVTDSIRPKLARLINADMDSIAICPSASYGLATAAQNLDIRPGQSILVLDDQFPSNVYTWRAVAERAGAIIKTIDNRESNASLSDRLLDAIDASTAIVTCGQVRWTDGALIDLEAVGKRAKEVGAALVVDLSQSCGALDFDIEKVKPDFVVCVGYKWLLGPYSLGFAYIAPEHRNGRPLEQNWIARRGSEDFTQLTNYQDDYGPGATRFDMGERSNFALMPAFEAAIDLILDWGIDRVEATLAARNRDLCRKLTELGLATPSEAERGPHYVGATLPGEAPIDLVGRLAKRNIFVSQRGRCLRITQHLYNNDRQIDVFLSALQDELAVAEV
ncbi:MAG: aminotransferase class V-fold PLP-dependent enzyme [Pseudomonadota bacterium]